MTGTVKYVKDFMEQESASGILLIVAMLLAMLMANTPASPLYHYLVELPVEVQFGELELKKPLLLWINDGMMAVFFMLVGLEIKREVKEGELSSPSQVVLPGLAAIGGMAVPALVFAAFNWGDSMGMRGWAIPTATDIAFALGILSLLGDRVPASLKLFLMTLAIMDDLGAIVIIAIFYTTDLSVLSLTVAGIALFTLFMMNRLGVVRIAAYVIVGVILWVSVLKSGVHATLAGVALAFAIPLRTKDPKNPSPLLHLEHALHPWVAFMILPLFAFANAGVDLFSIEMAQVTSSVPIGIMAGLFIGKQVGVFAFTWLGVKLGLAQRPAGASWGAVYGVSLLCGVGFTMSLFISALAFEGLNNPYGSAERLGVLAGSILSAGIGFVLLHMVLPKHRAAY